MLRMNGASFAVLLGAAMVALGWRVAGKIDHLEHAGSGRTALVEVLIIGGAIVFGYALLALMLTS
jgi:hypothetical protein